MSGARVSTKAVIVQNDALLVISGRGEHGEEYFYLPGGGQEKFETLEEALKRECLEEIDARVSVGDVMFVKDYIARNHEVSYAIVDPDFHQVDVFFECSLEPGEIPKNGSSPDSTQQGVMWLPMYELENAKLYPQELKRALLARDRIYLGDVN
jgi:8-oxo-dGTP diphosphatase